MNEQIKELIVRAFQEHYGDPITPGARERAVELVEGWGEKFAKLVINECAQRCEDIAIKHQIEETTYAAGKKAGAFECAVDLKQYFGIAE